MNGEGNVVSYRNMCDKGWLSVDMVDSLGTSLVTTLMVKRERGNSMVMAWAKRIVLLHLSGA